MVTEVIHGAPGSYKTSSLLSLYLPDALKSGRPIITNIRGFKDIALLNKTFFYKPVPSGFKRLFKKHRYCDFSSSEIIVIPHDNEGFQRMARFFHWAPKNAIIFMDEGQKVYPSRLTRLDQFDLPIDDKSDFERPSSVENAFDQHRHFGWDIYISTPNIAKVHKEIRQVAEHAYRHKNLATVIGVSGRYRRDRHNAEHSGLTHSHVQDQSFPKMDERVFCLYDSTTTDKPRDVKRQNLLLKNPRLLFAMFLLFCMPIVSAYLFLPSKDDQVDVLSGHSSGEVDSVVLAASSEGFQEVDNLGGSSNDGVLNSHEHGRDDDQGSHVIDLFESIVYYQGSVISSHDSRFNVTLLFKTRKAHIDSSALKDFGIDWKFYNGLVLLTLGNLKRFVPLGDPDPTYYHPDNDSPQGSSSVASEVNVLPF